MIRKPAGVDQFPPAGIKRVLAGQAAQKTQIHLHYCQLAQGGILMAAKGENLINPAKDVAQGRRVMDTAVIKDPAGKLRVLPPFFSGKSILAHFRREVLCPVVKEIGGFPRCVPPAPDPGGY